MIGQNIKRAIIISNNYLKQQHEHLARELNAEILFYFDQIK